MGYRVEYSNEGRRERTPVYPTLEKAETVAEFLRFQGAKRIRIVEEKQTW